MHGRERRPLQHTLTAIRPRYSARASGSRPDPNGERHSAIGTLEPPHPERPSSETIEIARRCRFSPTKLRYEYPEELVPAGETPGE